jgi:SAM-dependent methyltransferase
MLTIWSSPMARSCYPRDANNKDATMAKDQTRRRQDERVADALMRAEAAGRRGDNQTALAILLQAVRADPEVAPLYPPLARRLASMRFSEANAGVAEAIELAIRAPWIEPQPLALAAITAMKARHRIVEDAAVNVTPAMVSDPLLLALLERVLLPDAAVEAMLTAVRRNLLDDRTEAPPADVARFMIALARQALLNGWMWVETAAETAAVARLANDLAAADRFAPAHVVYALYRPLADLPGVAALAGRAKAPWREAARVLVDEPLEERRLASSLPRLGFRPNAATEVVKAQYEAYPYPRWAGAARRQPRPIREVAAALFPAAALPDWPAHRLDVLIAGCGTGKHAADVASRFKEAHILAVDLSAAALGYAARALKKTRDMTFAQADIMALGDVERRFDHIESVGVLHHLADPLAGWRILTGLLKPGGSMRVGFYSKRGRSRIAAARTALRAAGFDGLSDADLRAARAHALAAPEGDPARLAAGEMDFYAASGARDFLFHANEFEYSPGELAEMVEALGLRVLGLELTDPEAARRYRAAFPDDPAMADLRRWDAIEAEAPDTFRHMCQFWVVGPDS